MTLLKENVILMSQDLGEFLNIFEREQKELGGGWSIFLTSENLENLRTYEKFFNADSDLESQYKYLCLHFLLDFFKVINDLIIVIDQLYSINGAIGCHDNVETLENLLKAFSIALQQFLQEPNNPEEFKLLWGENSAYEKIKELLNDCNSVLSKSASSIDTCMQEIGKIVYNFYESRKRTQPNCQFEQYIPMLGALSSKIEEFLTSNPQFESKPEFIILRDLQANVNLFALTLIRSSISAEKDILDGFEEQIQGIYENFKTGTEQLLDASCTNAKSQEHELEKIESPSAQEQTSMPHTREVDTTEINIKMDNPAAITPEELREESVRLTTAAKTAEQNIAAGKFKIVEISLKVFNAIGQFVITCFEAINDAFSTPNAAVFYGQQVSGFATTPFPIVSW